MANQILEKVITSNPQEIPEGYAMLDEGTPELSDPKTVNFSFGTTAIAASGTTQTYPNGDTKSPLDIPFGATFPYTIFRANKVPSFRRLRLSSIMLAVNGVTAWTNLTGLALQDTSAQQGVLAYFPATCLTNYAVLQLPQPQIAATYQVTVSSYNSSTGAMTFPASTFITTTLAGLPFRVVGGTGSGSVSGIISANTATVITPTNVPLVVLDSTSVVEFPYMVATSATGTTLTASYAPFTNAVLGAGNFWVIIVAGTGAGQRRLITANSTTALTVATWTTNPDATSIFMVTDNASNMGAFDLGVGSRLPYIAKGAGLAIGQYGTAPGAGSNIRVWGFGKVA